MADFLQAVQTGSSLFDQAQRRRMVQEQLDMENAQLPLQQIIQTQQSQLNQFKIEDLLSTRQAEIDTKATLQEIGGLVGQKLASDDPMGAQQLLLQSLAKNPTMGDTTTFQQLQKYVGTSLLAKQQLKEMQGFMPTIEQIENPVTGKMEAVLRRGPNDSTLIQPPESSRPTANIQEAQEITRLQEALDSEQDPVKAKALQRQLTNLQNQTSSGGMTVFDANGNPIVQMGGKGGLTPASTTLRQTQFSGAKSALTASKRLRQLITPETVGIKGAWNRVVGEIGGQFPEIFGDLHANKNISDSAKFVAALRNYQSQVIKGLKTDSQIAESERKMLLSGVADIRLNMSVGTALDLVKETERSIVETYRRSAAELGTPIPMEANYPSELYDKYVAGQISFQELSDVLKITPFEEEAQNTIQRLKSLLQKQQPPPITLP